MSVLLRDFEAKQMSLPLPKERYWKAMGCSQHPATYLDTLRLKALLLIITHLTLYQKLNYTCRMLVPAEKPYDSRDVFPSFQDI